METIIETASGILVELVIALIGLAGAFLIGKIKQVESLKGTTAAMENLVTITQTAVGSLQQTAVNAWKEAGGGKLTAEQVSSLKSSLFAQVSASLSKPTEDLLKAANVDITSIIQQVAESYINDMKNNDHAANISKIMSQLPDKEAKA